MRQIKCTKILIKNTFFSMGTRGVTSGKNIDFLKHAVL